MDVDTIETAARALRGQVNLSIGWGTNLDQRFQGLRAGRRRRRICAAISLVCKVVEADGRPAVKLSDNPNKVLGPPEEIERYIDACSARQGMSAEPGAGLGARRRALVSDSGPLPKTPRSRTEVAHVADRLSRARPRHPRARATRSAPALARAAAARMRRSSTRPGGAPSRPTR